MSKDKGKGWIVVFEGGIHKWADAAGVYECEGGSLEVYGFGRAPGGGGPPLARYRADVWRAAYRAGVDVEYSPNADIQTA